MEKRYKTMLYLMIIGYIIYSIILLLYFNIINIDSIIGNSNTNPSNRDFIADDWGDISSIDPQNLSLRTSYDKIVFRNGTAIVLKGVSIYQPYAMIQTGKWNNSTMAADCRELAKNWHANVIRVPVYPEQWNNYPVNNTAALDAIVDAANSNGMYVIIDWHAIGNPATGVPTTNYPEFDPSMDGAGKFWDFIAEHYKNNPMVLYSILNEPGMGITWAQWRPLADKLVGKIREHNPRALVIVSGVKMAYDLSGVSKDPISYKNIVYETHVYPQSVSAQAISWDTSHTGLAGKYPVIVGEWGFTQDAAPDYFAFGTADSYGVPLVQFMSSRGYSWTAWAWNPNLGQPSMLLSSKPGNYTRTEYGDFVYNAMHD